MGIPCLCFTLRHLRKEETKPNLTFLTGVVKGTQITVNLDLLGQFDCETSFQ